MLCGLVFLVIPHLDDDLSVVIGLVARTLWRVVGER